MAGTLSKGTLQGLFEGIRDERRQYANTAERIGNAFLSFLHFVTEVEDERYLSRLHDDVAQGLIKFLKGIRVGEDGTYGITDEGKAILSSLLVKGNSIFDGNLSSPDFVSGFLDGKGWRIKNTPLTNAAGEQENKYTQEIDNLIVRGTLRIFEMVISQLLGENDNRIFTAMLEVDHYDSETGKVYLDTHEGRYNNPFRPDDCIMCQQYNNMPSDANGHYVTKSYELVVTKVGSEGEGEDMLSWVKFKDFTCNMEGATPDTVIKRRDTFVRVDSLTDPDRKGIIQMMTVGSDTPYMDIVYGMKTDPDNSLKGRLGNLQGIVHPLFGALSGFGEFLQNLYATGDFILRRTGESIDTKIQMLANQFATRFSQTSYDLTEDSNYIHNGQFLTVIGASDDSQVIDGWEVDGDDDMAFWIGPDGSPILVNGVATVSGNHRVSIENNEGRNMLRILNSGVSQKNALIRQPGTHKEYTVPSSDADEYSMAATGDEYVEVQDTLYVSVCIYAKTAGTLTIGFAPNSPVEGKQNDLFSRTVDIPYSGEWQRVKFDGKWNGLGDFVLRYTGDVLVSLLTVTDEPLDNLSKTVSTQILQTAKNIKLLGQNIDHVNGLVTSLGIDLDAENKNIRIYVEETDKKNREDTAAAITVAKDEITAVVKKLAADLEETSTVVQQNSDSWTEAASRFGENGQLKDTSYLMTTADRNELVSKYFNDDNSLKNTSGLVTTGTYAKLFTEAMQKNGVMTSAEMSTYVTKDGDGYISNAKIKADRIILEGAVTANDYFKINTDGSMEATAGKIAGFKIVGNGLTNSPFTNDAYIIFRNDKRGCFAGIGGNVLPISSGLRAVARFENDDKTDQWDLGYNIAMLLSAQNGKYNFAFTGTGNGLLNGWMSGYRYSVFSMGKTNTIYSGFLNMGENNVWFIRCSYDACGIMLPDIDNVREALCIGDKTEFAVPITIIADNRNSKAFTVYGKNNIETSGGTRPYNNSIYPVVSNVNGEDYAYAMGAGDTLSFLLVYRDSTYVAQEINHMS